MPSRGAPLSDLLSIAEGARLEQGWYFGRPTESPTPQPESRAVELSSTTARACFAQPLYPFSTLPIDVALRQAPKRLLIELSRHLEREALRLGETCVIAASFQYHHHFTPATQLRYMDLVERVGFVCALGEGLSSEPIPDVRGASLDRNDPLIGEWDVVVLSPHFSAALLARDLGEHGPDLDRAYEYALTYRRDTVTAAAHQMLRRIAPHRTSD